jgi:hypothetical protein
MSASRPFSKAFDVPFGPITGTDGLPACTPWPISWPCDVAQVDQERLDAAHSLASQLLWAMSGYRLGVCLYREAFRPAGSGACGVPYKDSNGNWRNNGRQGECCRILLTHRPVAAIESVVDGGVTLTPDDWMLEGSWLRRRNGCWTAAFPCDDPEVLVAYRAGAPFPPGTGLAVGEVACEYLSAFDDKPCRLPSRATSITRQGVTVTLASASEFLDRRRIGLPITDAWLEATVGAGPRVASRVYSPDLARGFDVV